MIYDMPSVKSHRSCNFGYGYKQNLVEKEKSPPPGTYETKSLFNRISRQNTISFHLGRNKIKFGSFFGFGTNAFPSPTTYRIKTEYYYDRRGGKIGIKLPT